MIDVSTELENVEATKKKLESMPNEVRKIVKMAVNDTAKQGRAKFLKKAKETYTIKASGFNNAAKIKNATNRTLTAIISVGGRPIILSRFKIVHNTYIKGEDNRWTGEAVKAKDLKKSPLKGLISEKTGNKAFVANVKAGNKSVTGIFQRKDKKGRKMKMLYGPSIPSMLRSESVYYTVIPEVQKDFWANAEKRIQKIISK